MKARQLIAGLVLAASAAVAFAGTYVSVGVPGLAVTHVSGNTALAFSPEHGHRGGHHNNHHNSYGHGRHHGMNAAYDPRMYRGAAPVYVAPAPVYVNPVAPVYVAPAPVYVERPAYRDYYSADRRQQQMQDLVNMCADPRTTRACSIVDGQNICITCSN